MSSVWVRAASEELNHDSVTTSSRWEMKMANTSLARIVVVAVVACLVNAVDANGQSTAHKGIRVDEARPLAAVLQELERRHGVVITYEEPPYVNADQIEDVTAKVRRTPAPVGKRVLVPRGGPFEFNYAPTDNLLSVLQRLTTEYRGTGYGGTFAVRQSRDAFHVVPVEFRNTLGNDEPYTPILDTRITIAPDPGEMRSAYQALNAISAALTRATGITIGPGTVPMNVLMKTKVELRATDEPARSVLLRTLAATGIPLSWRFKCGPEQPPLCMLNIHWVQPVNQGQ